MRNKYHIFWLLMLVWLAAILFTYDGENTLAYRLAEKMQQNTELSSPAR